MPANTYRCVDCGSWASGWEHRDYSEPLKVEPTCSRCNFKRGPAVFDPRNVSYPHEALGIKTRHLEPVWQDSTLNESDVMGG